MKIIFSVHLLRGPLPTRVWEHTHLADAGARARALADLHHCTVTVNAEGNTVIVDASDYYSKRDPNLYR